MTIAKITSKMVSKEHTAADEMLTVTAEGPIDRVNELYELILTKFDAIYDY